MECPRLSARPPFGGFRSLPANGLLGRKVDMSTPRTPSRAVGFPRLWLSFVGHRGKPGRAFSLSILALLRVTQMTCKPLAISGLDLYHGVCEGRGYPRLLHQFTHHGFGSLKHRM